MFSDASEQAYGTCAYVRWKTSNGQYESRLLAAKGKVAPSKKISIVRLELNGAIMSKRLRNFIKKETRFDFEREFFIVDSEIVRAMIQKESYGFHTFVALRIGEIQSSTSPEDWAWIGGKNNIADWTTRSKDPSELDEGSQWQTSPAFLKQPLSEWPLKQECKVEELPEQTKTILHLTNEKKDDNPIDINRFSSLTKLLRVTARVLAIFDKSKGYSLKNIAVPPSTEMLNHAKHFWVKDAQSDLTKEIEKGDFARLNPRTRKDGIIVVGGRAERWMEMSYDNKELPLLPKNNRLSLLITEHAHQKSHLGVSATTAAVRLEYWIPNLQRIVKTIKNKCVTCKRLDKRFTEQRMASLPLHRLKPALPWLHTSIDLFGPFTTRGEVNKRSRGKAYGIIFNCMVSRGVHIDLATNYSTEGFLLPFRRFVSIRGYPKEVYSDNGTQLSAASKELQKIIFTLDQQQLKEFGAEMGLEWHFTSPDGPWRNGCSESLIKSVKRGLNVAVGDQILSFSELQTVCFEVSNLVNERPIGRHPTELEDGSYLSPNHLLLGRATARVPAGPFKEPTSLKKRFELVQQITNTFWRRWTRDFFPSLLIEPKWHTQKRNLLVGDIVLVQDSNHVRGKWQIARVSKVLPGDDGLVRRVELEYKNPDGRKFTTIERPVQRLIVLVPVES